MNWKTKENQNLLKAFLALKTMNEAGRFLRDLMTEKEISEFANRLKAAEMLTDKISYIKIEKQTGLSSRTIARVAKWLNGKAGGYKIVFSKLHHHKPNRLRRGLF